MSQHDNDLANGTGSVFRADVNAALVAIATQQSGASAPSTTFAYQRWADTTNNLLKQRNAANSGWLTVSSLDEVFAVARSSNTILGVADRDKTFSATGTFTQTLTAVATLGDGWACWYRNDGSGVITLDPNASETINGATTLRLYPGDACRLVCNGSVLKAVGLSAMALINAQAPSGAALADIAVGLDDNQFERFILEYDLTVATDDVYLRLRVGTGGGPTYQTAGYGYSGLTIGVTTSVSDGSTSADSIALSRTGATNGVGNAAGEHISGRVEINNPDVSQYPLFDIASRYVRSDGVQQSFIGSGMYGSAGAITALRLLASSGNISGSMRLYGVRT